MKRKNNNSNNKFYSLLSAHYSLLIDIVIVAVCISGALICVFLFQQDLNAVLQRYGEQPIGTITYRYNMAQRRFIDRLIWDRLRNDSPLYNGDIIRTAELSEAVLSFSLGDIIELYSNTLVQIFSDEKGVRIDFARGGISVLSSSDNGMIIDSGSKRISVDPSAVLRAFSSRDGTFDLSVSEGEVFLQNIFGNDDIQVLNAGSAVKVDSTGEIQNLPSIVPLYPPSGIKMIATAEESAVPFIWNKVNTPNDSPAQIQIAYDRAFSKLLYEEETSINHQTINLPEGNWFWRLSSVQEANDGQYSKLTVTRTYAPELITPYDEQIFLYRSRLPAVRFQWSSSPEAFLYRIEADKDAGFTNPVLNVQVRAGSGIRETFTTSALGEGTWYWRVTPIYASGSVRIDDDTVNDASLTKSFTIAQGAPLTAPLLISPADKVYFNIEQGRRDSLFSWKKEDEAVSYTFRISPNSDMSSPVIVSTTTDTFYRYSSRATALTAGTWYWTVQFTAEDTTLSPVSELRSFIAIRGEVVQRLVFPPDNYTIANTFLQDTRFTWKTNLPDTRFQVSSDSEFTDILINENANLEQFSIRSLDKGSYYWRITASASVLLQSEQMQTEIQTEEIKMTTQSRRFYITDSLPPTVLGRPDSGVSAQSGNVVVRRGVRVNFSWQPVPEAEYYVFKLHRGDTSTPPVTETIVYDTKIDINMDNYNDGIYTWSVQGLARASQSSSRRTGLSASQQINVRQLRPVELRHPRDGFQYAGLDASRTPDTASWFSSEQPHNVQFVLASDSRMRNIVHQWDILMRNFTLPRLSEGDYYWIIKAETAEGYDITSPVSHFRVLPIPRLPAPSNYLPADRHTITAADVAASRSVNFSWNSVQGANGYIVTIFQGTGRSRRSLIESEVLNQTNYQIEDIRLLGRGTFSWQVEAVFALEDGFIEQHGNVNENRLTIDIPAPRQVRTRDSGTLYGL